MNRYETNICQVSTTFFFFNFERALLKDGSIFCCTIPSMVRGEIECIKQMSLLRIQRRTGVIAFDSTVLQPYLQNVVGRVYENSVSYILSGQCLYSHLVATTTQQRMERRVIHTLNPFFKHRVCIISPMSRQPRNLTVAGE